MLREKGENKKVERELNGEETRKRREMETGLLLGKEGKEVLEKRKKEKGER